MATQTHTHQTLDPLTASLASAEHDQQWIETCFDRHGSYLRRVAAAHIGPDSADDAVSETFTIAWSTRDRFDPGKGSEREWLVGILINRCRLIGRTDRRWWTRSQKESQTIVPPESDPASAVVARLDAQDRHANLFERISDLPPSQRTVMLLVAVGEMSTTEVASALQMKHSTVRSHLRRARRSIASALEAQERHHA
jgi:RNA polymerase sigma-70 factor (ECF subfamily)